MNLQHQEPPKLPRRSPSPSPSSRHRSLTPPTRQSRRTVGFVEPFNQHNNPPPMVFVSPNLSFIFSYILNSFCLDIDQQC